jgi:hypothetical protein
MQHGRIRLLIEMFPYSTVVLADNENFCLTVCVTTTSPLIEAYSVVAHNADPYLELTQGGVARRVLGP